VRITSYSIAWVIASLTLTFVALDVVGIAQARIVLTGSMVPTINPGDVVIDVKPSLDPPAVGKIVTYTGRRLDGSAVALFTHRIIAGDEASGFTVKGDANPSPDTQKPKLSDIDGVVLFTIPFIGKLMNTRSIILVLLGIFGIWLIWDAFREKE
jgi:signal peptidase